MLFVCFGFFRFAICALRSIGCLLFVVVLRLLWFLLLCDLRFAIHSLFSCVHLSCIRVGERPAEGFRRQILMIFLKIFKIFKIFNIFLVTVTGTQKIFNYFDENKLQIW